MSRSVSSPAHEKWRVPEFPRDNFEYDLLIESEAISDWELVMPDIVRRLADACRPVLVETARRSGTIGYGKLAQRVGPKVKLPELSGNDQRLHDALGILSKESYEEGQNLLVSVVVVREDTGMPGAGFYYLAQEVLGAYPLEASTEEIFVEELRNVHQRYSRSS